MPFPHRVRKRKWLSLGRLTTLALLAALAIVGPALAIYSRIEPTYTIEGTARRLAVFRRSSDVEHFLDGLRKAGIPER
jgi:adenylate cyclase